MKATTSMAATSSATSATSWPPTCGRRVTSNATRACAPRSSSEGNHMLHARSRSGLAAGSLLLLWLGAASSAEPVAMQNAGARPGLTLAGKWHYIVDPYENGYYDYRREPFDAAAQPRGGYFLDRKPADKSELVEYDFDTSPTLTVPGDWN